MTRLPDWPERLAEFLEARRSASFAWGSHDCAHFAAGAVLAITGVAIDVPRVADADQAASVVDLLGGIEQAVSAVLHLQVDPQLAQRGDVVLVQFAAHRPWLAVCVGDRWASPGRRGLSMGPMSMAISAWRV